MTRNTEDCMEELLALLPPGRALSRRADSNTARFLRPIGAELARLEAMREQQIVQISPINATNLLEDYERMLAPDPCQRDPLSETLEQRQRYAEQRWNPPLAATPAALIALAAGLGVSITVETFRPDVCGVGECGDEMGGEPESYSWLIHAPPVPASPIECILRQWVPQHRGAVFVYDLGA